MNKICTSIEQSQRLIKLGIDVNTADMRYGYIAPYEFSDRKYDGGYDMIPYHKDFFDRCSNFSANEYDDELPCWSLAALLDILNYPTLIHEFCGSEKEKWFLTIKDPEETYRVWENDPIDACYEMILKLHEHNLL